MKNTPFISILLLFAILQIMVGCKCESTNEQKQALWEKIAPYFSLPEKFKNQYGSYRSPLKFYNGDTLETAEEWEKRRKEILTHWHEMMGPWPDLIEDQQLEYLDSHSRENFIQHKVRFSYVPGEKTEGYLLVPDKKGAKPAVITVYYEPETAIGKTKLQFRDYAYQLAKRGFVTLSLGRTDRESTFYYPSIDNARVEPLSMMAYAAANAWNVLANLDEVDSTRIGIVGHSFGGKWAMFASCLYEKFACSVWSDPGIVFDESRPNVNYWEPWYLGYHPKPWRESGIPTEDNPARGTYPKLIGGNHDLHELHALMAPRPFLVSGGAEDPPKRWIPLNHTIAVNKLLGYKNRVAMTNRKKHSPNKESNKVVYQFFRYFLEPDKN